MTTALPQHCVPPAPALLCCGCAGRGCHCQAWCSCPSAGEAGAGQIPAAHPSLQHPKGELALSGGAPACRGGSRVGRRRWQQWFRSAASSPARGDAWHLASASSPYRRWAAREPRGEPVCPVCPGAAGLRRGAAFWLLWGGDPTHGLVRAPVPWHALLVSTGWASLNTEVTGPHPPSCLSSSFLNSLLENPCYIAITWGFKSSHVQIEGTSA